jgi:hypothetical protein
VELAVVLVLAVAALVAPVRVVMVAQPIDPASRSLVGLR